MAEIAFVVLPFSKEKRDGTFRQIHPRDITRVQERKR